MFTQQGTTCIYYGTEVGIDGFHDPDCRKCMIWEDEKQDKTMLQFTKDLIAFRKAHQPVLTYGDIEWIDIRDDQDIIGFKKTFKGKELLFYFSQNNEEVEVLLPVYVENIFSHLTEEKHGKLLLEKNGFAIFTLRT